MNDELYNELFNQQMQQLNGNNTSIDTPLDQLNSEQATEAGLFHPEEEQTQPQEETQEEPPFKENTTFGERLKDVVNVSGREFARAFVPKALEDDLHLTDYKPKTRAGQASLYYTRYLWGASGLALGGEVGAGIKAAGVAANAPKAIKAGDFLAKTLGAENLIKTGSTNAFKKAGVWTLNKATQGLIGGALLDWNLYDPDEDGHLADMFGKTDNAFISYLQTDEDDSELEARFKNVVEGAVLNMGFNVALDVAKPLVGGMFKGIKKLFKANTAEEAVEAAKAVGDAQVKLERVATVEDLWDKVDELAIRAEQTGEELDQLLIDNIHPSQLEDARKMGKMYLEGDEPFIHSDGTWDISVSKWDDAYKVSPEEYQKQLRARDEFNAVSEDMVRYGDTAIQHQNQAVKDTWVNRGWIGADEELTAKNAQKIVKNYTDKFEIDNNIKVEFVDGLHIKGQAVEGNTTATKYQGKVTKSKQNAIDKQKLKISKLEDKITMAEGGNKAVKDPVDNLKEELRIAKNELKELEKEAKGKNRIPDITIRIDTNAQNPYATLRAEIEHARDIAKGEVPNQKVQHFSRYQGMNEAEVAPQYTYKKSQGKARALSGETVEDTTKKAAEPSVEETTTKTTTEQVKETSTQVKPQTDTEQLKLDFNSKINEAKTTEEVIDNMLNNPEAVKSYGDVENIINKTIELDPSISGWTFKELAEGGDKTAEELFKHLGDENIPNYKELLNNGDYEALNRIAQKELGASKTLSALYDKVDMLASDATKEQKKVIIDTIHHITDYVNQLRSGSGALLNAQKFVNKALDVFGSMRLSELSRDGIRELSDILQETVEKINLNFTRGNVVLAKQQIMKDLYEKLSPEVFDLFTNDKQFAKGIDEVLNNMLKKEKLDPSTVYQQLEDIFTETLYDDVVKAVKAAPTEEGKTAVVKNWMNQQGGLKSFYIHNLLSGAGTLSKNVLSGGINTLYFPAKKILGGIISKNPAMTREGWNTYKLMLQNMGESWRMCCQAFKNGEGKLVNLGTDSLNMGTEDAVFSGFREWKVPENMEDLWHQIQNLHSVMTRAMGASDEFMTQLNYRSITRAKCLEQATELAEKAGMANNEKWINEQADKLFTTKFNKAGQPLDTEAYNEARSILYQDNLDGTQLNLRTGEKQQMREQTLTMKAAEEINNMANGKFGFMKFMFPFVKTGANILQQNLDHNALYALFSPAARRRLKSDPKAVAEVMFGTTSFLMCSLMALNGNITGSAPVDPKEAKALFETGWRPYSIKIGDKYWSYQGYEPIHTMLGFAADGVGLYQAMTDPDEIAKADVAVQQGMAMLVNNFLDKAAFRTGLKQLDLIMNPNDTDEWKKAMAQTVSGMLPASSFVKNVSTLGTREAKTPKTFSQRIFNNYFNRGLGEYRRDVFGEKQTITNAILSTAGQDTSDMPEYQALAELAEYGYSPSEIRETIANSNISYRAFKNPETNQNAYDAMQDRLQTITIDGKTLREAVRELVTSQEYQEMMIGTPDKDGFKPSGNAMTKMNAIKDIFREYNQEAERQVLSESDIFLNNKGQSLEEYKEEIELKKEAVSNGENLDDIGDKIISTF